jgi:cytidine deaminase
MALDEKITRKLIETAVLARRRAYAPYSHYLVGAALITNSGRIFDGVNVENAAYPATICAERVAVFKAVSEGGSPCGSCRQVLAEFGLETVVLIADAQGRLLQETSVAELLPGAFRPEHLEPQP